MAGGYDGSIRIDTLINSTPLTNGLNQIESKIKAVGSAIGLAFGTKELINFGKNAITAASDLVESQNVVDTAFGEMSHKMEQFASIALETYGISELTAKTMGSTYMAMAKGMGVASDAASDMALTLTGRLSDIMSFYNKTQSEVDTIGRAMITGETEPLKAIGVVMTQTNLSAYAMAQGFSKAYTEMEANEQLLVRYKYFLEQTSLAQGDFANTSDSWANQIKLLGERVKEFMTNLGNVLINVFTPAVQFANEAVMFLNELFFSNDDANDTTAAKNAEAVADEVTAVGTAAEKSGKELNNLLSSFDELHIISGASLEAEDNTGGAGVDTADLLGVNLDADAYTAEKAAGKYREVLEEIYFTIKNHPFTQAIIGAFKTISDIIGNVSDKKYNVSSYVYAILDIVGAIVAFSAIKTTLKIISSAISTIRSVITTAGAALGVGAGGFALAAGIATGFALIMGSIMELSKTIMSEKIADKFGNIKLSFEQIDELCSPIADGYEKLAKKFEEHRNKVENIKEEFSDLSDELDKTFKKYEALGSISPDDIPDFESQVNSSIDKIDELLNEQTFGAASILEAYFSLDGIDENEQSALDEITDFGTSLDSKVESIRSQIQSITQAAIDENRGLLESEIQNIRDLYDELEKYANIKSASASSAAWDLLEADMGNLQIDKTSYDMLLQRIDEVETAAIEAAKTQREEAYRQVSELAALKEIDGASQAEIDDFKKEYYSLIDNTYDDERVDAVAAANNLRSRIAQGLAQSLIDESGISYAKTDYSNPIDYLMNYGDITVQNMIEKISDEMKDAENQILNSAFDKERVQKRFDETYGEISLEKVSEELYGSGQLIGTSYQSGFNEGASSIDYTYIPTSELMMASGIESGKSWGEGFKQGLSESGFDISDFSLDYDMDKVAELASQLPTKSSAPYVYDSSTPNTSYEFPIYINEEYKGTVEVNPQKEFRGTDFWITNGKGN